MKLLLYIFLALFTVNCYAEDIQWDRLIEAVIQVESGGNSQAYNKNSKATGLMQITPIVLKEFNQVTENKGFGRLNSNELFPAYEKDLYNPDVNRYIGTWYLHRIAEHYLNDWKKINNHLVVSTISVPIAQEKDIPLILSAYNAGIGRLRKCNYNINCMPAETKSYVRKVLKIYQQKEVK